MWYNEYSPYSITPYHYDDSKLNLDKFFNLLYDNKSVNSYSSKEEGDKLFLSIDLPGAKPSDVKVESLLGQIKIWGKQKGKEFSQIYSLSKVYDPGSGVARLEDGVLNLTFSKFKSAKTSTYNIEVK